MRGGCPMSLKEAKKYIVDALLKSPDRTMRWDDIYNYLTNFYPKSTVSKAKADLIDEGVIKELKTVEGKKIILIREPVCYKDDDEDKFDEETFRMYYEYKIKEYFKSVLSKNPDCKVFDVREFLKHFPDSGNLNDKLINYPYEVRKILTEIFLEAYEELYGEKLDIEFIHISNPIGCSVPMSKLSSKYAGKLVEFRGMVIQATKIKPRVYKGRYICPLCGAVKHIELGFWDVPEKVGKDLSCPEDCRNNKGLFFDEHGSHYVDFQEIRLQEPIEETYDGKQHNIIIFYDFYGPEFAVYTGYVKVVGVPIIKRTKKGSVGDVYIHAFYIEKDDDIEKRIKSISDKDLEIIKKIANGKDAIKKLSEFAFREVDGYELIKLALLLQMVGGVETETLRSSINILLISDPGVGKSTLMRALKKRFPFVKYTNAVTTSGPGLTVSVVRENTEFGESWVLKLGTLAKADNGIACIDELSRNKSLFKYLLEVMEQQRISVSKAGIEADVLARCGILAACNPIHGDFDREKSVLEQINLPPELIDRFDLIFPIFDIIDEERDESIADFMVDSLIPKKEKYEINGIELTDEILLKYIIYAKQLTPIPSDEAKDIIKKYYVKKRKEGEKKGVKSMKPRQLGAIIRLSAAHAKLRLSETIEKEDVEIAIYIVEECLKAVAYDPETGSFDVDKILHGPKKERDKLATVYDIIKKLAEKSELVKYDDIVEEAKKIGLNEDDLELIIEKLKKYGDIDEPKPGRYRLL